ncbi:thiamine pyrophosphate-binding protein [Pandoraea sp.]|uniref:thiamine pyrophosphate-binding protein n=1 Tax=Pandoraea sp. TaxID=1883445 RepID=UPI0035AD96B8
MNKEYAQYSVSANDILDRLHKCGVKHVVTVPDMLQIALHQALEAPDVGIQVTNTATEDQAVEVAAGLYAGGQNAVLLMQNQGFYACINSVRALGLDSSIPLCFLVGQFGREFSNLGQSPLASKRLMVRMLEPLLDTLDIPYWRLESSKDADGLVSAWNASRQRSGPAVAIAGHFLGWSEVGAESVNAMSTLEA